VIAEKARPSSPEPREAMLDSGSYWLSGSAELDKYDDILKYQSIPKVAVRISILLRLRREDVSQRYLIPSAR